MLQEKQSEGRFHWSGMKYLRNATDNIFAFDERPHIFHGPYFAPSNVLTIASLLMLPNQTGITLEPVPREISVQAVRDLLGERKWPLYLGSQPVDIHGDREVLPYLAAMHDIIHYLCWQDRDADYLEDALASLSAIFHLPTSPLFPYPLWQNCPQCRNLQNPETS